MLFDPTKSCALCLAGDPVATVPSGALRGKPCCEACLSAIREAGGGPRDAVTVTPHAFADDPACPAAILSGTWEPLHCLHDALDLPGIALGAERPVEVVGATLRDLPRWACIVWSDEVGETWEGFVEALRRASDLSAVDLRILPRVVREPPAAQRRAG